MSTKTEEMLKLAIEAHYKEELSNAVKRGLKKKRITRQIRVSDAVAVDLKHQARAEKRTMSKVADDVLKDGIRARKFHIQDSERTPVGKPFPHQREFRDL